MSDAVRYLLLYLVFVGLHAAIGEYPFTGVVLYACGRLMVTGKLRCNTLLFCCKLVIPSPLPSSYLLLFSLSFNIILFTYILHVFGCGVMCWCGLNLP